MNKITPTLLIISVLALLFFMGCTSSDTIIIQNAKLSKLFDTNTVGGVGEVPFINVDGNALETSSGFDFNKDTNTLFVGGSFFYTDENNDIIFCDGNSGC